MGGDPDRGRRPFMLGRARRDAKAVAGGLRAAVSRPGTPVPGRTGDRWHSRSIGPQMSSD